VRRLCNEIQLFDLCDLERCRHKEGLFCTDQELVGRFESIADVEDRPVGGRVSDETDEDEEGFDDGYEEDFDERLEDDNDYADDGHEDDC
jgi:hypothetical protein